MRILSSSHVTSESGTGLVHCAPAHGDEDYKVFRSYGLISSGAESSSSSNEMICHVSEGLFSEKVADVVGPVAARTLIGQPVLEGGSRAVVELLKQVGRVLAVKRYSHRYPYDWKTDKPIIVTCVAFFGCKPSDSLFS